MKKLILAIFLAIICIFSISIEDSDKLLTKNEEKNYIVYNMEKAPMNLVMTDSKDIREKDLLLALFEGVVKKDINGDIKPALAESYEISEDKIEYNFKIRQKAKYSNGKPINAEEFVKFFESFLQDEKNIYSEKFDIIFGVKDFREGKIPFSKVAITSKDDNTLCIRLNKPSNDLLNLLSNPVMGLRDYKDLKDDYKDIYNNILYSGPFIIKDMLDNGNIIIEKNSNYYNSKEVTDEKISITFIDDNEKALAYFETGEEEKIDIFINPPINESLRLTEENKLEGFPGNTSVYLNFNLKHKGVSKDINFRNAINSSISKDYFAQQISRDFAVAASSYGAGKEKIFDTYGNKSLGEKFLSASNYSEDVVLKLFYENNSLEKRIAEDIVKDLEDDLSINIKIVPYEKADREKIIKEGKYDMILYIHSFNEDDEMSYFQLWSNTSEENNYGFSNNEYDSLLNKAKNEPNLEERRKIYADCEKILSEHLPSVPIYNLNTVVCRKPYIGGIQMTRDGNIIFDNIMLEEEKLEGK
ncbi:MAG: peptide ABC transporter substrate-binding protein [Clostridium argentinense]|uniref:Peptide ABC transporter substrate-binding protein n=1 Tax=Clostridium faecium TaxID=2762223 RepID=A0ABR8YVL2_9CLOT|nr:peptide ABC transporter substrate-binding protein [Clostridium faecium]MBD8048214.1 peptide ABC transporter substrate-binding protein [Clostridium faecium]MBS5824348.1 peptide ABC transporter substrate-binding protein [Clostridium argentinense]MDU1349041.1 peptide ABC transporter substrate-binding protein [Clostridium argentinense]